MPTSTGGVGEHGPLGVGSIDQDVVRLLFVLTLRIRKLKSKEAKMISHPVEMRARVHTINVRSDVLTFVRHRFGLDIYCQVPSVFVFDTTSGGALMEVASENNISMKLALEVYCWWKKNLVFASQRSLPKI